MIRQLAHVCFFTKDAKKMIEFYSNQLELKIKFVMHDKSGRPFGYYFECGQTTFIEVFDQTLAVKEWGGQVGDLSKEGQYRHLCFEVTGLAQLKKKFENRGIKVTEIKTGLDHSWQAWIQDPDGNDIELMEYTDESMQLAGSSDA